MPNNNAQQASPPASKGKPRREPLFSRSRLFVIVGCVMAASLVFFRFVWVLSEYDLKLPAAVISLSLGTFVVGQFIRHRLHRSWIAWSVVAMLVIGGALAFHWQFDASRRETKVADWIAEQQGGNVTYNGVKFNADEGYGYFKTRFDWWLPLWLTEITGKSYFAELDTFYLYGPQLGDELIPRLADVQHLDSLYLANTSVTAAGIAQMPIIPGLKHIQLDWRQVSPEAMQRLGKFAELEQVRIVYPNEFYAPTEREFVAAHLSDLAGLNQIKHLSVSYDAPLSAADSLAIASLAKLERLSVTSTQRAVHDVQPAGGLLPLASSRSLEYLTLGLHRQEVSKEELEALAGAPSIQRIHIYRSGDPPFNLMPEQLDPIINKYPTVSINITPLSAQPANGN